MVKWPPPPLVKRTAALRCSPPPPSFPGNTPSLYPHFRRSLSRGGGGGGGSPSNHPPTKIQAKYASSLCQKSQDYIRTYILSSTILTALLPLYTLYCHPFKMSWALFNKKLWNCLKLNNSYFICLFSFFYSRGTTEQTLNFHSIFVMDVWCSWLIALAGLSRILG